MIEIEGLTTSGLQVDRFSLRAGETWCCVGAIGSGMEHFCDIIGGGETSFTAQRLELPADLGMISFRSQQDLYEEELRRDNTDFLDRLDPGTPARAFLTEIDHNHHLIELFDLDSHLDKGYRQLSSGQARKLLLLAQLTRGASLLVMENPFEGLDQAACAELDRVLGELPGRGLGLLLFVGNQGDIPAWCTHLAVFRDGALVVQGEAAEVRAAAGAALQRPPGLFRVSVEELRAEQRSLDEGGDSLITLRGGFARYGEVEVFNGLDLVVNRGDHTLITGPNGCGKSTLLQIITGDHPLCYVNDLTLFGRRRGSGESIWELKRHMGIVGADLHRNHRVAGSALAVVVSGLYDSIGLYTRPTAHDEELARRWLDRVGLAHLARTSFRAVGYGEQRLLLLARALIKAPRLLVLDEATQGLDESHREALLDFLAEVAVRDLCTILYVSHRPDEYRSFFTQHLRFA